MYEKNWLYHYGVWKGQNTAVTPACWPAIPILDQFDGKTINAVTINRGRVTCLDCLSMMGMVGNLGCS